MSFNSRDTSQLRDSSESSNYGVKFKYDPFGRRIYKLSSAGTSVFAFDGDNLVEETNATGGVVARYSQGLNIDEPLAMLRSSTTSYYQADGLGSVTSLTNAVGAAAQNYTYDSFGNIIATTGSLVNSFRYHRARMGHRNKPLLLSRQILRFTGWKVHKRRSDRSNGWH